MQDLKVTLVQANQIWEDVAANLQNYESLLENIDSDLILLPEMFQTCFSMKTALAEPWETSESVRWLQEMAQKHDAAFYTSLMIQKEGNSFVNRGVFVDPKGSVTTYDKRKTFGLAGEDQHFTAGSEETIVEFKGWKIQLQICYDLRFPEISRNRISNHSAAYDVLLYVANWPEKRASHWKTLLVSRAIENQCFVVGVNRVGEDANGFTYSGDSQLIDALGNAQTLEVGKENVSTYVMKYNELMKIRELLPFLKDT